LDAWNERLRQFHILKQNFALESYIDRINSFEFMNPKTRVRLFTELREEQVRIYKSWHELLWRADNKDSFELTKQFVQELIDELNKIDEDTQKIYDKYANDIKKDMENVNEDLDILVQDLRDFLIKNDAELIEGQTFDLIVDE